MIPRPGRLGSIFHQLKILTLVSHMHHVLQDPKMVMWMGGYANAAILNAYHLFEAKCIGKEILFLTILPIRLCVYVHSSKSQVALLKEKQF